MTGEAMNPRSIILCLFALAVVALTWFAGCESLPSWLADFDEPASAIGSASGTAEGTGSGFGGAVTVTVTMADGWITEVRVTGPGETPTIGGIAITRAPDLIKKGNSARFNAVSGATITSNGIMAGAQEAIDKIVAGGN
jgi:fumarate reductase flavoprotein subunit